MTTQTKKTASGFPLPPPRPHPVLYSSCFHSSRYLINQLLHRAKLGVASGVVRVDSSPAGVGVPVDGHPVGVVSPGFGLSHIPARVVTTPVGGPGGEPEVWLAVELDDAAVDRLA